MANVELELQGAIIQRLKADPAVTALVNGRIYDAPPANAVFPYVTIGPTDSVEDDADCITAYLVAQQVDCWSRAVGKPEVKKVLAAVRKAMHNREAEMPLSTNGMSYFQYKTNRVTTDPDGLTSHAILGFEASVEEH